jgi:protein SCO1
MKHAILFAVLLLLTAQGWAAREYAATGVVLKVDQPHKTFVVSCQSIAGFMDAMAMPFDVRTPRELDGVIPGMTVEFTLIVDQKSSYAEHIHVRRYESVEQDPLTARRLKLLNEISNPSPSSARALKAGQAVPDFTLTDQDNRQVSFAQFAGKVVAINFIYTSCALPNFCFRTSNNFGVLQKRFKEQMGRELVLLTVTFDPLRDKPDFLRSMLKRGKPIQERGTS